MEGTEMDKLISYLYKNVDGADRNVIISTCMGGPQVIIRDADGNWMWDAVSHQHSYGGNRGLIEVMEHTSHSYVLTAEERECDNVLGYLTAEDIIKRLES